MNVTDNYELTETPTYLITYKWDDMGEYMVTSVEHPFVWEVNFNIDADKGRYHGARVLRWLELDKKGKEAWDEAQSIKDTYYKSKDAEKKKP